MKKVTLIIDGYKIEADEGQNLLQAALDAGIYIPHLCYHPDLKPLGNCKLCSVEIEGEPDIVQACETTVKEGIIVHTNTEKVKKLRMIALELILASHPKDCTSCDKYLNCELQALLQYMGVAHSRLREIEKENIRIPKSDSLIKREMQRCIQCGRCVRVCEEVRGVGVLTYNKRNGETYVYTKDDKPLVDTDCRFCGACVEVCPTGALQDMKGVFPSDGPRSLSLIPCKYNCPAHTDIPLYIRLVQQGRYNDAVAVLREKLTFPHTLGYVCTHPCEEGCKRSHLNEPIAIKELKRFAVENDKEKTWMKKIVVNKPNGKKLAVIGAGPAGITAAYYLGKKGYEVEVYERNARAGGMLSYGIPKYRLPQEIVDNEIDILKEIGKIKVYTNFNINSVNDLKNKGYDAIFIAIGATRGKRPPMFNRPWKNAIDAVDFCRMASECRVPDLGDTVTVYGGGNVGFDCARIAKRLGVKTVRILCLEPRDKMLADPEEIKSALEEDIEILNSRVIMDIQESDDVIKSLIVAEVKEFKFTENGLELDIDEGSKVGMSTDVVIFATGQQPELTDSFGIELVKGSFAKVDEKMMTNIEGVFAGGDVIYGTKSVVDAIASGRQAAINIDKYLGGDGNIDEVLFEREPLNPKISTIENFSHLERKHHIENEVDAKEESIRCLQCDLRLDIKKVKLWVDPHFKRVKEVRK